MPIARITGQGLAAIACGVVLLWICALGEDALARQAYAERVRVMREIERMQRRTLPVSVPSPWAKRVPEATAG